VTMICIIFVGCVNCARDQNPKHTIAKQHREMKSHLVKKHLRRLKKQEGLLKLVDGRGDYEGMQIEASLIILLKMVHHLLGMRLNVTSC
jgi:hypothetical protein